MSTSLSDFVDQLETALGPAVCRPGSDGYRQSLGRVFFPDAARRRPPGVIQPRSTEDVSTAMKLASQEGVKLTVRGGGLSSNCVDEDAVMLDLSTHLRGARQDGDRVIVEGGSTVGAMLDALAPSGRVVPVGIVGLAGVGLLTRGGVGYLTRELGLALDHLVEVEMVLASGDVVRLSDKSQGEEAELWWAARGAAPAFGTITSVTLRTDEQGPVFVDRLVVGLDALPAYFRVAPELPRDTTMGAVLGYAPDAPETPVAFIMTACRSQDDAAIGAARAATTAVAGGSADGALLRTEMSGRYLDELPQMAIPGLDGTEPGTIPPASPDTPNGERGWFFGKAVFVGPTLDGGVAEGLTECIHAAPTTACRIDFQQTGGAIADVADGDTAFCGRQSEWNIPLNAIAADPDLAEAGMAWARSTLEVLAPHTIGVYSVELRPGFDETEAEIQLAYGDHLARLRALRQSVDPTGVLGVYPL